MSNLVANEKMKKPWNLTDWGLKITVFLTQQCIMIKGYRKREGGKIALVSQWWLSLTTHRCQHYCHSALFLFLSNTSENPVILSDCSFPFLFFKREMVWLLWLSLSQTWFWLYSIFLLGLSDLITLLCNSLNSHFHICLSWLN